MDLPIPAAGHDAKHSASSHLHSNTDHHTDEASEVCCRFCRGSKGTLIRPCRCDGSVGAAHSRCLAEWVARKRTLTCEVCREEYTIYKTRFTDHPASLYSFDSLKIIKRYLTRKLLEFSILCLQSVIAICAAVSIPFMLFFIYERIGIQYLKNYLQVEITLEDDALVFSIAAIGIWLIGSLIFFSSAVLLLNFDEWQEWVTVVMRAVEHRQEQHEEGAEGRAAAAPALPIAAEADNRENVEGADNNNDMEHNHPPHPAALHAEEQAEEAEAEENEENANGFDASYHKMKGRIITKANVRLEQDELLRSVEHQLHSTARPSLIRQIFKENSVFTHCALMVGRVFFINLVGLSLYYIFPELWIFLFDRVQPNLFSATRAVFGSRAAMYVKLLVGLVQDFKYPFIALYPSVFIAGRVLRRIPRRSACYDFAYAAYVFLRGINLSAFVVMAIWCVLEAFSFFLGLLVLWDHLPRTLGTPLPITNTEPGWRILQQHDLMPIRCDGGGGRKSSTTSQPVITVDLWAALSLVRHDFAPVSLFARGGTAQTGEDGGMCMNLFDRVTCGEAFVKSVTSTAGVPPGYAGSASLYYYYALEVYQHLGGIGWASNCITTLYFLLHAIGLNLYYAGAFHVLPAVGQLTNLQDFREKLYSMTVPRACRFALELVVAGVAAMLLVGVPAVKLLAVLPLPGLYGNYMNAEMLLPEIVFSMNNVFMYWYVARSGHFYYQRAMARFFNWEAAAAANGGAPLPWYSVDCVTYVVLYYLLNILVVSCSLGAALWLSTMRDSFFFAFFSLILGVLSFEIRVHEMRGWGFFVWAVNWWYPIGKLLHCWYLWAGCGVRSTKRADRTYLVLSAEPHDWVVRHHPHIAEKRRQWICQVRRAAGLPGLADSFLFWAAHPEAAKPHMPLELMVTRVSEQSLLLALWNSSRAAHRRETRWWWQAETLSAVLTGIMVAAVVALPLLAIAPAPTQFSVFGANPRIHRCIALPGLALFTRWATGVVYLGAFAYLEYVANTNFTLRLWTSPVLVFYTEYTALATDVVAPLLLRCGLIYVIRLVRNEPYSRHNSLLGIVHEAVLKVLLLLSLVRVIHLLRNRTRQSQQQPAQAAPTAAVPRAQPPHEPLRLNAYGGMDRIMEMIAFLERYVPQGGQQPIQAFNAAVAHMPPPAAPAAPAEQQENEEEGAALPLERPAGPPRFNFALNDVPHVHDDVAEARMAAPPPLPPPPVLAAVPGAPVLPPRPLQTLVERVRAEPEQPPPHHFPTYFERLCTNWRRLRSRLLRGVEGVLRTENLSEVAFANYGQS